MKRKILLFILVFALTVPFFASCGAVSDDAPAIKVGETSVSLAEFRYQYNGNISEFKKKYASRLESTKELDFSKPLDEQIREEDTGSTWADYFVDVTVRSLKNYCILAEDARVNGETLSSDDIAKVDAQIKSLNNHLEKENLSVEDLFGEGMTVEIYRSYLERTLLGSNRYYNIIDTISVPYEKCLEYANSKPETYFALSYYFYEFKASDYNASYTDARNAAEDFAKKITDPDDFEQLLYDNILDETEKAEYNEGKYFVQELYHSYLSKELQKWGFEAGRKPGDYTIITGTDGLVLCVCSEIGLPSYLTYDIRHIYIPTDDNVGGYAGVKQAEVDAMALVDEWENGSKTEDLFASIAVEHSKDALTAAKGGLSKNTSISGFGDGSFDWITSKERKYGDVSVFTAEDGAHIIFYIGEGSPVWQIQAEEALKATEFNEHMDDLADKYNFKIYDKVIDSLK